MGKGMDPAYGAAAGFGLFRNGPGACEYADDSPAPPAVSPEPLRPAPPRPPTADPRVAEVAARKQAQLDSLLGPSPEGVVLAGSGGWAATASGPPSLELKWDRCPHTAFA